MPAVPEHLDDDAGARESEVDANHLALRISDDLLPKRRRESGAGADLEKSALEPAVASTTGLRSLDHVEELRDAIPAATPDLGDSPVEEILGDQSIAKGSVEGRREGAGPDELGDIDDRARHRECRNAVTQGAILRGQLGGGVKDVRWAFDESATRNRYVERAGAA
jgi:hypothetical protein